MKEEWLSGMFVHFACAFCSWTFDGLLSDGRIEADSHRAAKHPEIGPYRRPRRRPKGTMRPMWRSELANEDRVEVESDRRRRAALHGVELDDDR